MYPKIFTWHGVDGSWQMSKEIQEWITIQEKRGLRVVDKTIDIVNDSIYRINYTNDRQNNHDKSAIKIIVSVWMGDEEDVENLCSVVKDQF